MEVIRSKALLRALISLFMAGSCVGTTMPMMRRFGARLGMMGRQALRTAQFDTRRRVATQAFKPRAFKSQKFTQSRLTTFGQRALRTGHSFAQKPNTKTWLKGIGIVGVASAAGGTIAWSYSTKKISLPEDLKIVIDNGDWDELSNRLKQGDFENKQLQKAVIDYCVENWSTIDHSIKSLILTRLSDASKAFAMAIKDNFSCEITKDVWCLSDLLGDLDFKQIDQVTTEDLASLALQEISLLYSTTSGRECLIVLAGSSMKALQGIMAYVEKNASDEKDDFITLLNIQEKRLRGERLTQSEAYLLAEMRVVVGRPLWSKLAPLQKKIMQKEEALNNGGYDTFYHAQSADKYFPIVLDTFLYSVSMGEQLDDFYFMHTKQDILRKEVRNYLAGNLTDDALTKAMKESILSAYGQQSIWKKLRNFMIAEGKNSSIDTKEHHSSIRYMLFLNGCLRGNIAVPDRQSFPAFFKNNYNAGNTYCNNPGNTVLERVFSNHGLGCYKEFEQELGELWQEYNALSKYGTLYQIAIPSKDVDKTIMLSTGGAVDKTYVTIDGKQTRDMKKIVSAVRDPDNFPTLWGYEELFVALMTYDKHGLMNPACGAKMFAYMMPTDEQKYQAWQKKWSNLMVRIKKHVEDNRSADYVSPATTKEYIGLLEKAYQQVFAEK